MKTIVYTLFILFGTIGFGCNSKSGHLSLATIDNEDQYSFEANYSQEKLPQLKDYLDKEWPSEIVLNRDTDFIFPLKNDDRIHFTAKSGQLKMIFDKKTGSIQGYVFTKKLAEGISGALK